MSPYVPQRGDVVWLDFNPRAGRERAGRRAAFVVSPTAYNGKVGLFVVCPVTIQRKGYPFEVPIPDGLGATGVILSDQIRSLDWRARNAGLIGPLPDAVGREVLQRVNALLR